MHALIWIGAQKAPLFKHSTAIAAALVLKRSNNNAIKTLSRDLRHAFKWPLLASSTVPLRGAGRQH